MSPIVQNVIAFLLYA